jgi:hypothetical protein
MLTRNTCFTLVCVLLVWGCSDSVGPARPGRHYVGYSPTYSLQPGIVDWYLCASYDGGQTWDCEYERTDYGTQDYWDDGDDSFHTTARDYCYGAARYCDSKFQPGGGGPYTAPRHLLRTNMADDAVMQIPTCPVSTGAPEVLKAWCGGHTPTSAQLGHIQSQLTRMHNLGGECDVLATIGDALLAHGTLRLFPQANFSAGGWAPLGGGSSGPRSWALISEDAVDRMYDQAHGGYSVDPGSGLTYNTDLSTTLAHELDHLHGNDHITNANGTHNGVLTPNTRGCADIWMGN